MSDAKFVETWKGIAIHTGRSERWARMAAQRSDNRLPVYKVGGIVRMEIADYDAWIAVQRAKEMQPEHMQTATAFKAGVSWCLENIVDADDVDDAVEASIDSAAMDYAKSKGGHGGVANVVEA